MADRRGAAASGDRQRTHRAAPVAPRNCRATAPRSRNGDGHRAGTSTTNKTRLAPVGPGSVLGRNHLSEVGRGDGDGAEHQPVAPGSVRELRVVNDVRAGHRGTASPVRPCGRRCPGEAQASGDERNPDEPAKHLPKRIRRRTLGGSVEGHCRTLAQTTDARSALSRLQTPQTRKPAKQRA